MHNNYKIAKVYAEGLFEIAKTKNSLTEINEQLNSIKTLLKKMPEFYYFLVNPLINQQIKKNAIKIIFNKNLDKITLNFLLILIERRRIIYFYDIVDQFILIWNKSTNTSIVEISSVISLTEKQQQYLINKLKEITKASYIELKLKIDPNLIGGLIIKFGSNLIDLSLKGQIEKFALYLGIN